MEKYQNKYRIPPARAPFWDYAWNASYFVTVCTQYRICWFGNVVNGQMVLSEIGKIAHQCWSDIPIHFPFVKLDAFVVMPNHVHGIVTIDKSDYDIKTERDGNEPQTPPPRTQNKFGPQSKNLASIIRGFKIGVTKNARLIQPDFAWQTRYHDHIIRDESAHYNISAYIINNPAKWSDDQFYMS